MITLSWWAFILICLLCVAFGWFCALAGALDAIKRRKLEP